MPKSKTVTRKKTDSKADSVVAPELLEAKTCWREGCESVILLAEDHEDEVLLIRQAFAKAKLINPLHVVSNGEEAIAYLQGNGKYANRSEFPLPGLLLLDLKMPRTDGFEVLQWVRQ